jgi:hypothetical protein
VTAEARAQEGLVPVAAIQAEPRPPPEFIDVSEPPSGSNPLGALLAVIAASFVVGLLARRRAEEAEKPATRIREGFAGLGEETAEKLADLLERTRRAIGRRGG